MALVAPGRRWVGSTVYGDGRVYEYPNRPGEYVYDERRPSDGSLREVRIANPTGRVAFFDFSTNPPTLLPLTQGPPSNQT